MRHLLLCLTVAFAATGAVANAAQATYVPPELEPWREWVLKDQQFRQCPLRYDADGAGRQGWFCRWPGVLTVNAGLQRATFQQRWELLTADWVPLPGSQEYWPENVRIGASRLQPVERDGQPQVWLEAGVYRLSGELAWTRRPAALPIPAMTGLVELELDGRSISNPERTGGALWFGRRPAAEAAPERIEVRVHRLVEDGLPITLTTIVELAVSGPAREAVLGKILPSGFAPVALASPLPARIEGDGRLRLQVRPGNWSLEFVARATGLPEQVGFEAGDGTWADAEIWSYRANPQLRLTVAESLDPVDPSQVGVPAPWAQLPAFQLTPGTALTIRERGRGSEGQLANRLRLNRQMWLDFDGDGFTVADDISGQMETDWRLEMAPPYQLASARAADGYRLVTTRGPSQEASLLGIEVREPQPQLQTLARLPDTGSVPATGWQQRFDNVEAVVHLPLGYELLAVNGADYAPGSWISRWRLVDYFVVLLISVAFWRLFGVVAGVVALVMLALTFHEPNAPLWSWLAVLVSAALARHAPEGGIRDVSRLLKNVALLVLGLIAILFSALQLRAAMYPQLDPAGARGAYAMLDQAAVPATRDEAEELHSPRMLQPHEGRVRELQRKVGDGTAYTQAVDPRVPGYKLQPFEPGALLQTGPGMPNWSQKSYRVAWNGPVDVSQQMTLVILDVGLYRVLRVVAVALIVWLIWTLVRDGVPGFRLPGRASMPVWAAVVIALAVWPGEPAQAEIPTPEILQELRQRLTEAPECVPRCAEIAEARVDVTATTLSMALVVQAQSDVVIPLPGRELEWAPTAVSLDNAPVEYLQRNDQRELLTQVPAGTHIVSLSGPLPATDTVRISFPLVPRRASVSAAGWEHVGVVDARLPGGVIELVRIRAADAVQSALEPERFPPFVRVTRQIVFDVDWRIATRVERIAPRQGAFTVAVPLLDDERVVTESVRVRDDHALIAFGVGARVVSFESTLPRASQLTLTAPAADQHVETWQLLASPTWRLQYAGTPLTNFADEGAQYWMPQFHPRPGETLQIDVSRPEAVAGPTLAFDAVDVFTTVGERSRDTQLLLNYRSSRGGQHGLLLPADAEVVMVAVDGQPLAVRPRDGELQLPIIPGAHAVEIRFNQQREVRTRTATPLLHIGAPGSNVTLKLQLPRDRWVLATRGPRTGPAVLYWPELALFVLIALALGRLKIVPLKTWEWVVLGVGFSTHSWPVLVLIVAWLFAFAWRHRAAMPAGAAGYNLVQVALALLTGAVLLALVVAIPMALLGAPNMQITGNFSSAYHLVWFADRTDGAVPAASVLSAPVWIYKTALLLWALWLSFALIGWLRWAWQAWSSGDIWRKPVRRSRAPDAEAGSTE